MRLKGKIILISGGARGQGAAEARLCVAEGAKVVVGDVLEKDGKALAAELGAAAVFVPQDVTKEEDWTRAVDAAVAMGGLHGLINNAGIYQPRSLMDTSTELFERHFRINQLGCFLGMKAVVPAMLVMACEDAPNRAILCAGAGTFEAAHVTLTQGVWLGSDARTPERLAQRLAEVSARAGEQVPQSGSAQGANELGQAQAAAGKA